VHQARQTLRARAPRTTCDRDPLEPDSLTSGQRRFALRHEAVPAFTSAADALHVLMYRVEPRRTLRWLVDPAGRVVDETILYR
jgi:hypothetical protein